MGPTSSWSPRPQEKMKRDRDRGERELGGTLNWKREYKEEIGSDPLEMGWSRGR